MDNRETKIAKEPCPFSTKKDIQFLFLVPADMPISEWYHYFNQVTSLTDDALEEVLLRVQKLNPNIKVTLAP